MIKIKTIDLISVACAAEIWFRRNEEQFHTFGLELKAASNLKKALYKVNWDEDAELMIDELPF